MTNIMTVVSSIYFLTLITKENVDLIFGNVYHTDAYYMCYAVVSIWFGSD